MFSLSSSLGVGVVSQSRWAEPYDTGDLVVLRSCTRLWVVSLKLRAKIQPAVTWAPAWREFEILGWAENIFLVTSSADVASRKVAKVGGGFFATKSPIFSGSSLQNYRVHSPQNTNVQSQYPADCFQMGSRVARTGMLA